MSYFAMENNLYDQILILAKNISNSSPKDLPAMRTMARELYEKITILSYLENHTEELTTPEVTQYDISMLENEWQILENEAVLDGKRNEDEPQENEIEQDEKEEATPIVKPDDAEQQILVDAEMTEKVVSEEKEAEELETNEDIEEEKIADKPKAKRQKHTSKVDDTLQKSLFDQDLFSSEIIGFDPDEDIFVEATEVKSEANEPIVEAEEDNTSEQEPKDEPVAQENTANDDLTEMATAEKKKSFFSIKLIDSQEDEDEFEKSAEKILQDAEKEPIEDDVTSNTEPTTLEEEQEEDSAENEAIEELNTTQIEEKQAEAAPQEEHQNIVSQPENVPTVNDVIGQKEEKPQMSLNDVLASKNIVISLNDRLAFINNLFDGEVDDFENTVRYVFSQHDVDVVVEYITEIVKPYYNNWLEKEQYEKRFMDIVIKYFSGR